MQDKEFNPYAILGVDKDTSDEDIKKIFKKRSKECHPDTGGTAESFAELKKAFDILSDPAKRNLYDEYGIDNFIDIENEAKLVAVQIVVSALDGLPSSCEVDEEISKIFNKCLKGLKEQEVAAKEKRDNLQRRLDGIQKKPADDFLTNQIIGVIEGHNKMMKQTQLNYRIHDAAFKLVQEYKFDITKIPFTGKDPYSQEYFQRSLTDMYRSLGIGGL